MTEHEAEHEHEHEPVPGPDETLRRRITRYDFMRRLTLVAVLILGATIVFLQLRVTVQTNETTQTIRATQKVSSSNVKVIKRVAREIESCTNPKGACAKRGQKQTAKAVGDIGIANTRAAAAAAACAARRPHQTFRTIYACTVKKTAQRSKP